jgi:hypothetical protein
MQNTIGQHASNRFKCGQGNKFDLFTADVDDLLKGGVEFSVVALWGK